MIYGTIFAVFGFMNPSFFLLSVVFFWSGYGKVINIKTVRGDIKIPIKGDKKKYNEMVASLKMRNPKILLIQ